MREAFKEWAVVVDALGRGEQIIILRKGGIAEGRDGFHVEHSQFWLFPTAFHQQRDQVIPAAQVRYDAWLEHRPPKDQVRIEFGAAVTHWWRLDSWTEVQRLAGQHIWREEVMAERFHGGGRLGIFALAVRVVRLPQAFEFPVISAYGGCKSWIELTTDLPISAAVPVLDDGAYAQQLLALTTALFMPQPIEGKGNHGA